MAPVSTTLVANFATSFASVVDTGGIFAAGFNNTGINDTGAGAKFSTGGNLPPVSTTLAKLVAKFANSVVDTGAILPPVSLIPVVHLDLSMTPVANNGNNIRLLRP